MRTRRKQRIGAKIGVIAGLVVGALFAGLPVLWMLSTSFKANGEVFQTPPRLITKGFSFNAYQPILSDASQLRFFLNSYIVALSVTALTLLVAILASYGFSRFNFPLKRSINAVIVSVQAVPPITLVIPYFGLVVALHLYNTYPGLILTHMVFTLPYAIIMTTAYFNTLPRELDESVKVDGAGGWTALWRILVPISVPGLIAVGVYTFMISWNEYLFALTLTRTDDMRTVSIGIVDVSEQKNAPLILGIHPDEVRHVGADMLAAVTQRAHRSSVPIAIHWDHGASYQEILTAIRTGFTSVMIDGSMLSFEDNVALTRKVVDTAHAVGLSVEGELGTIGKTDGEAEDGSHAIIYTDPDDALVFVRETGVDSLAVAIGTSHGIYPANLKPELKLGLLKEIKENVNIPLVLHGGSNNPDDEIAQATQLGINKITISSDIKVAYHQKMREVLADESLREPLTIQPPCIEAMKAVAGHKIDLFGAAGEASPY